MFACAALLMASAPAGAATKLVIGTVPNVGDGSLVCAIERGYFRDQGLDVEITPFRTGSAMTPLIVRGDIVMMGGGVSVSYFNSVAQGMPLRYFVNRAQAPVWHGLVLRKGLAGKVTSARDLKGLKIATTAVGGLSEYELGKLLETVGLSLDDVETKHLAMPSSVAALQTGAIDAAVLVPPFDTAAVKAGAVKLLDVDQAVKPRMEVSGLIYNVEWARQNADVLDRFTVAYIKGLRCYDEAAKGGANRNEMIEDLLKYSPIKDRSVFDNLVWSHANPDGRVMIDSLMDQQDFYIRRGYLKKKSPVEAIVDEGPVERALQKLGAVQK
jgi:NitT/TauT family transport system substrate-binding protein